MAKSPAPRADTLSGLIVAAYGKHFIAELDDQRRVTCVTRGKKTGVACGDHVEIAPTSPDQGVIERIAPRTSLLYRSDLFREKIIAANVDQIVIVVAAVPSFYEELINRCLVAAESVGIRALIVLNKTDLPETAAARETLALYETLGYPLLPLCARQAVTPLNAHLLGQTSVLVGQSGMGKSTLINALLPEARAREGEVSTALDSGKHTTTHARMYRIDSNSGLIDCPGVQAFGLHHLSFGGIEQGFVEFAKYLGQCRFRDCHHKHEPGCALRDAVAAGEIDARRLELFQQITANKA